MHIINYNRPNVVKFKLTPYSTLILRVFPLHKIARVGRQRAHWPSAIRPWRIPTYLITVPKRHRETEKQAACNLITALCVASRGKKLPNRPMPDGYTLVSIDRPLYHTIKILGASPVSAPNMNVQKVDYGWFRTMVLFFAIFGPKKQIQTIFAVCVPKFTKFARHVREWSQFAMPFSGWQYLVPVWRCLQ